MKIGSLVECVDDVFDVSTLDFLVKFPKRKKIYIIRHLSVSTPIPGVLLEEIVNPPRKTVFGMEEPKFKINRFREIELPLNFEKEVDEVINNLVVIN